MGVRATGPWASLSLQSLLLCAGSIYRMLLQLNSPRDRKNPRTAPAPTRLWGHFDPANQKRNWEHFRNRCVGRRGSTCGIFLKIPIFLLVTLKGLLNYAIKIVATWVACKKLHARIARPFTPRIQHRAIFKKSFSDWIFNSVSVIVFQFVIVCLKYDTSILTKFYEICI